MGFDGRINAAVALYLSAGAILRSSVKKRMANYVPSVWEHDLDLSV
jgi:hypothetical protein